MPGERSETLRPSTVFLLAVAQRIRDKRESKNISQGKVAEALGVSGRNTVSSWERGLNCPDSYTLWRLARILDCTPNDLFPPTEI